jgi:hypothetical protein
MYGPDLVCCVVAISRVWDTRNCMPYICCPLLWTVQYIQFGLLQNEGNWDSSVGFASMLLTGRPRNRGSVRGRVRIIHSVHSGPGFRLAGYPVGTGYSFPRNKVTKT